MSTRIPFGGELPPLPDAIDPAPEAFAPDAPVPPFAAPLDPRVTVTGLNPVVVRPPFRLRSLRCGCYLVNYTPVASPLLSFDGTLRVECHSNGRTVSGDLYQRRLMLVPVFPRIPPRPPLPPLPPIPIRPRLMLAPAPTPANEVPIFPRNQYRYYLRVTQVLEHFTIGNSFTLGFQMYRFKAGAWNLENTCTALMSWTAAPAGFPSPSDYLAGDVKNAAGAVIGRLTMGWVSQWLRRAVIEIDRVNGCEAPLNNGAGVTWHTVLNAVGWQVTLDESDANVAQPSGEGWSNPELHQAMVARRDLANLDAEWRYHVLAVRLLDATERGIMYDNGATDSNNVPREGASLSSHWNIPNTATWGLVRGMRFGTAAAPYFRTAVHEIGHAMGLYHNTVDNGIMNTTDVIAASGTAATPFPNNIQWGFAPDDAKRLRHYPDVFVRPGGTAFGTASIATPPITPNDLEVPMEALELRVLPLLEALPLGAPVRATLELINLSDEPQVVPASLSLKGGYVRGRVTDPSGTVRTFSPLFQCIEEQPLQVLEPGQSITDSVTLLRGGQGALFAAPGPHTVTVEVAWQAGEATMVVSASASIVVMGAQDVGHARAANAVLSEPDTLLSLAVGGDHLLDGNAAIRSALNDPVLRPHFAYIEAKRLAGRQGKRKPDWEAARDLIDENTVMSPAEIRKARKLLETAGSGAPAKDIARVLDRADRALAHAK